MSMVVTSKRGPCWGRHSPHPVGSGPDASGQRDPEGPYTPKVTGSWEHRQEARVRLRNASALPVAFEVTR